MTLRQGLVKLDNQGYSSAESRTLGQSFPARGRVLLQEESRRETKVSKTVPRLPQQTWILVAQTWLCFSVGIKLHVSHLQAASETGRDGVGAEGRGVRRDAGRDASADAAAQQADAACACRDGATCASQAAVAAAHPAAHAREVGFCFHTDTWETNEISFPTCCQYLSPFKISGRCGMTPCHTHVLGDLTPRRVLPGCVDDYSGVIWAWTSSSSAPNTGTKSVSHNHGSTARSVRFSPVSKLKALLFL